MSGFPSPQPFPNDFRSEDERSSLPPINSSLKPEAFLHPIDEADDFYDPFSDLSLFLSRKVKREIQESGTAKKWSGKIEANLLAKILPELKKQFPRYRLGATALKKVWEKVGFYYKKIEHHKGAFEKDGKLNLPLMIRENLKKTPVPSSPLNLPPYHQAHQVAVKISECIATLEGRRPDLDHLTKMIWATLKNTLRDLSSREAKSPYEDYDKLDKLIVKTLLEVCSHSPHANPKVLKESILKTFETFGCIHPLAIKNQLTSTLSMVLASKLCPITLTATELTIPEKQAIESFVAMQIKYSENNQSFSADTHCMELVQRILALYPIANALPRNLSDETLKETIQKIYHETKPLPLDSSIYVFINAEMHLMKEEKSFENFDALEERIIKAYHLALALPKISQNLEEVFEFFTWKILSEQKGFLNEMPRTTLELLERELGNILIDHPDQSFRIVVRKSIQFFKQIQQLPFHEKDNKEFWLRVKNKTETWSLQNEMLCRWIHFDDQTPLFTFFKSEWNSKECQILFLKKFQDKALKKFPLLRAFENQVKARLWILHQYFWYSELSTSGDSSYSLFLRKELLTLKSKYPQSSESDLMSKLKQISHEMLPLTPFENIAL